MYFNTQKHKQNHHLSFTLFFSYPFLPYFLNYFLPQTLIILFPWLSPSIFWLSPHQSAITLLLSQHSQSTSSTNRFSFTFTLKNVDPSSKSKSLDVVLFRWKLIYAQTINHVSDDLAKGRELFIKFRCRLWTNEKLRPICVGTIFVGHCHYATVGEMVSKN